VDSTGQEKTLIKGKIREKRTKCVGGLNRSINYEKEEGSDNTWTKVKRQRRKSREETGTEY
jgi:hypothetical protein